MALYQISINFFLFLIGLLGVAFSHKSILVTLIGIELALLSASLNFVTFSSYLNDVNGQIFTLFILTVAAAEACVGLAILIVSFNIAGVIEPNLSENKG